MTFQSFWGLRSTYLNERLFIGGYKWWFNHVHPTSTHQQSSSLRAPRIEVEREKLPSLCTQQWIAMESHRPKETAQWCPMSSHKIPNESYMMFHESSAFFHGFSTDFPGFLSASFWKTNRKPSEHLPKLRVRRAHLEFQSIRTGYHASESSDVWNRPVHLSARIYLYIYIYICDLCVCVLYRYISLYIYPWLLLVVTVIICHNILVPGTLMMHKKNV